MMTPELFEAWKAVRQSAESTSRIPSGKLLIDATLFARLDRELVRLLEGEGSL